MAEIAEVKLLVCCKLFLNFARISKWFLTQMGTFKESLLLCRM